MKTEQKIYQVNRVFKHGKNRVVDEFLTRSQAMEIVQTDIKENPNADYYMLTFDKMPQYKN